MYESYEINNLIIGKIYICNQFGGFHGFNEYKSKESYIFYKEETNGKDILKNVKEIFTDDEFEIYDTKKGNKNHEFNKPYIVDAKMLTEYLTQDEIISNTITKWRLIEIYNQINLEKNKQKTHLQLP